MLSDVARGLLPVYIGVRERRRIMIKELILSKTSIPILKKVLDISSARHKVIANNIANVATPGYRRQELSFEEELRKVTDSGLAVDRTHPGHLGGETTGSVEPEVYSPDDETMPNGINNVDIDKEMAALAQNHLIYYVSTRLLTMRINAIKMSIKGRE